jgi:hypothetical protein
VRPESLWKVVTCTWEKDSVVTNVTKQMKNGRKRPEFKRADFMESAAPF